MTVPSGLTLLTDWFTNFPIHWLTSRLTDCLTCWPKWLSSFSTDQLTTWPTDWANAGQSPEQLIECFTDCYMCAQLSGQPKDWLIVCFTDWLTDRLSKWQNGAFYANDFLQDNSDWVILFFFLVLLFVLFCFFFTDEGKNQDFQRVESHLRLPKLSLKNTLLKRTQNCKQLNSRKFL